MEITLKTYSLIFTLICISLIIIHGFWPSQFVVDSITIVILIILGLPFLAPFLKTAKVFGKFFGAEFEFKDEISATEKLVDSSIKKAKEREALQETAKIPKPPTSQFSQFTVFDLSNVKELIDDDPVLALAALRIEIEKKLRIAANKFGIPQKEQFSIRTLLDVLVKKEILHPEQINAIKNIQRMCNKAVHGAEISQEEAEKIVDLAEKLNKSFSIGYWINFDPNTDYKKQGLVCEWEHCIEHFPLQEERNVKSCPVFGHDCPGGPDRVKTCGITIDDLPKSRFAKSYNEQRGIRRFIYSKFNRGSPPSE